MFADLGAALASFGTPALAIVLFTIVVRLALHPFYRAAVRGEKAKARLAPEIQKLQKKYGKDLMRFSEESQKVYKSNGVSMFAGMLPMLATIPFFMVIYQVVTTPNPLLEGTLFGVSLGSHFTTGFAWVFFVLFGLLAVVAYLTVKWQQSRMTAAPQPGFMTGLVKVLPFGTILVAAYLPLAAGVYLLTTTTWTIAERALLYRILS
ncbi:YidC/Oxa1 family membrane protein insertase [Lentzea sp. HUAS12]|uniref:YidC/Oxa1 family membrane protein insertase n=1 Tax=Lentzea sp. HUAS12 TaxID=2951806 RepID=UPI0020A1F7FB|nr:YidC/Oxa1 family membrane protein insertase [Lentzea sp. HUAS12]USX48689.1 YidC/Oxa1 family membrane protein insertase [Lentzea sp. HUAS12]